MQHPDEEHVHAIGMTIETVVECHDGLESLVEQASDLATKAFVDHLAKHGVKPSKKTPNDPSLN